MLPFAIILIIIINNCLQRLTCYFGNVNYRYNSKIPRIFFAVSCAYVVQFAILGHGSHMLCIELTLFYESILEDIESSNYPINFGQLVISFCNNYNARVITSDTKLSTTLVV